MGYNEKLAVGKPGEIFELNGTWYKIVEEKGNKLLGKRQERFHPQPVDLGEEWYHPDGKLRICKNPKCPNLVPRSKNPGRERIYCNRRCLQQHVQRRYNSAQGCVGIEGQRDVFGRLYAIRNFRTVRVLPLTAKHHVMDHLDDRYGRCPEAAEASSFRCPAVWNPNCIDEYQWSRWHQTGPWPGACLIAAALKDNYWEAIHHDAGQPVERRYTIGRGATWRWRDEDTMLPMPEGIVRP